MHKKKLLKIQFFITHLKFIKISEERINCVQNITVIFKQFKTIILQERVYIYIYKQCVKQNLIYINRINYIESFLFIFHKLIC